MSIIIETIFDIGFRREQHISKFKEWIKNGYIEYISIHDYPKTHNPNYFKNLTLEEKLDYLLDQNFDVIYFSFNEIKESKILSGMLHFYHNYTRYFSGMKEYLFLDDKELQNKIVNFSQWLADEIGAKKFLFTTDMWFDNINGDHWKVDYNTILKHCKKPSLNENLGYNFF